MKPMRHALPVLAAAVLIGGCGGGDTASTSTNAQQQFQRPPGGFAGGLDTAKLASALGVSETKLKSALQSIMPQGGPGSGGPPNGAPPNGGQVPDGAPPGGGPSGQGGPPSGGRFPTGAPGGGGPSGRGGPPGFAGGQLTKQLADKLGIPEEKVQKAFQSVLPQRPQAPQDGSNS